MAQSTEWCFTLNNWLPHQFEYLNSLYDVDRHGIAYIVIGKERGANGTPHLQGFVKFNARRRFGSVRRILGGGVFGRRIHLEHRAPRSTAFAAAQYCKKEDDYVEYGEVPQAPTPGAPRRTDWERFRDYCKDLEHRPTPRQLFEDFPGLYGRYEDRLNDIIDEYLPNPVLETREYRDWQADLADQISQEADDRSVIFVVDPQGGTGKSFFVRKFISEHFEITQRLSVGKRDDLAYAIDPKKKVFLFDIPRGNMEFLQYGILEQLKDRMVFSPKYKSVNKILEHTPHVVIFCNEMPDLNAMTEDRYKLRLI